MIEDGGSRIEDRVIGRKAILDLRSSILVLLHFFVVDFRKRA